MFCAIIAHETSSKIIVQLFLATPARIAAKLHAIIAHETMALVLVTRWGYDFPTWSEWSYMSGSPLVATVFDECVSLLSTEVPCMDNCSGDEVGRLIGPHSEDSDLKRHYLARQGHVG